MEDQIYFVTLFNPLTLEEMLAWLRVQVHAGVPTHTPPTLSLKDQLN